MSDAHDALVKRAVLWLSNSCNCALVMAEPQCWSIREFPDAIGWTVQGDSFLIECKVSREDFRRDKHKPSKRGRRETMGRRRWYMTPPGLLTFDDIPDGFGLLETNGRRVREAREAAADERPGRHEAELPLLINATRTQAWLRGFNGRRVRLPFEHTTVAERLRTK